METIPDNGAFPLPDSDSYYCTDSNSMQKCSTGTDSYGDSYANHRHFASLFEKLIVVSTDPPLACIIISTLFINKFHLSGTYIGAKMGTVTIGIGIGIGIVIGLGSVETVLHIFVEANFIGIGIGVSVGIGVGQWKHTITL